MLSILFEIQAFSYNKLFLNNVIAM